MVKIIFMRIYIYIVDVESLGLMLEFFFRILNHLVKILAPPPTEWCLLKFSSFMIEACVVAQLICSLALQVYRGLDVGSAKPSLAERKVLLEHI